MKKTRKRLAYIFWAIPITGLAITLLFESDMILPGGMAGAADIEFILLSIMVLATLGAIPMALRLFTTQKVKAELAGKKEIALRKWGTARLCMLGIPLIANTLMYYVFMKPAFGYLAIILLICLIFVYPAEDRCNSEVRKQNGDE